MHPDSRRQTPLYWQRKLRPGKGQGCVQGPTRSQGWTDGAGWVGPGRPRLFPAVADVLPPGSMQTPFRLRIGEGDRAHSRGVRLGSPLTPDCPRQWSRSCPEPFSCSPRFRGVSPLGPVLEQGTPGGPLRKRPGLRLRVGPADFAGSPASGSHQARGGGSCRGGPGRGTCLLQATHRPNPRERGLGPTTAASAPWPAAPPPGAHAPPSSEATPQPAATPSFPWLPSYRSGRCSCKGQ